jgi:transcriptional regulator with XRE-family HTH domain
LYSKWEAGRRPSIKTMAGIADYFNVPVEVIWPNLFKF